MYIDWENTYHITVKGGALLWTDVQTLSYYIQTAIRHKYDAEMFFFQIIPTFLGALFGTRSVIFHINTTYYQFVSFYFISKAEFVKWSSLLKYDISFFCVCITWRYMILYMAYFVKWSILDRLTSNLVQWVVYWVNTEVIGPYNVDVMAVLWLHYQ